MTRKKFIRILYLGLLMAVIYGPLAAYANWEHGVWIGVKVGLFQAFLCFLSTTYSTSLMLYLFDVSRYPIVKYLMGSFGTGGINLSLLIWFHVISGTPNIFATILPPLILAAPFYLGFPFILTLKYVKEQKNAANICINELAAESA